MESCSSTSEISACSWEGRDHPEPPKPHHSLTGALGTTVHRGCCMWPGMGGWAMPHPHVPGTMGAVYRVGALLLFPLSPPQGQWE